MMGLQCPKRLYLTLLQPELVPPTDPSTQARYDTGHEVGLLAQKQFPGGIAIDAKSLRDALAQTTAAMNGGALTLFEATFAAGDSLAKADILRRREVSAPWHLIEVKSSTSVKNDHLLDVAVQAHILKAAGHALLKASVMVLNPACTAPHLENLFQTKDVTDLIAPLLAALPARIDELRTALEGKAPPDINIGPHCESPYTCPLKDHCWKDVPSPSVFDLGLGKQAWEMLAKGIVSALDPKLPAEAPKAERRIDVVKTNTRWVDGREIARQMADWRWPLRFLDFETINHAVPRYDGTHPYEHVPFQFSCLLQRTPDAPLEESHYLHEDASDPRDGITAALVATLGNEGSIVAYWKTFEGDCLKTLADRSPAHSDQLLGAKGRLVDPLPVFRAAVYDAAFEGSFSIKSVAPALLGKASSYEAMTVGDGGEAQRAFLEIIDDKIPLARKRELRDALLAYCRKDTEEMAALVEWLFANRAEPEKKRAARKRR